ncbi:PilZ domain-containing protein [Roseibium litorale]|uniref:PilZ domain-containing protein n=1 Tax=Roseibium litorale TaxID=2803841 RepID=A0ABR9CM58_9HYPH|nr:PilZ domain-containing protein [Roseibium litorale]MBD8891386.1 PilZ domain-containing protein [Roseibium litorale]
MNVETRKEGDAPDLNALPVLVVDLESLKCVQALAVNFSDWGCKLLGPELGILNKNIGIRLEDDEEFVRGRVTGRKPDYATVVFDQEENGSRDKRREKRYPVTVPATLTDLSRKQSFPCTITNASRSGCRVDGQGLRDLPPDVLLCVDSFGAPVVGQVMWKNPTSAGLILNWNGMRGMGKRDAAKKPVAQKKTEQTDAIKLQLSRL